MIDATDIEPGSDWSKVSKDEHNIASSKQMKIVPDSIPISLCTSTTSISSLLEYVTCVVCLDSIPKEPFELQCGHIGMLIDIIIIIVIMIINFIFNVLMSTNRLFA
jgi:hypothetical protein